jgi:hypothetical protein
MEHERYLSELVALTRGVLGDRLVGAYVGGSYALGAYERGRSDLDVALVVPGRLGPAEQDALVGALRHESLPCPARGLELVVYTDEAAASPAVAADFELNLNTGAGMRFRADAEPDPAEEHWFAIDRAILRDHALALAGPPPAEVFGLIPRARLLPVLAEAIRWYAEGEDAEADDTVLNAARALCYAETGTWASKPEAGAWALAHAPGGGVVAAALAARAGGAPVDLAAARAFALDALAVLEARRP